MAEESETEICFVVYTVRLDPTIHRNDTSDL